MSLRARERLDDPKKIDDFFYKYPYLISDEIISKWIKIRFRQSDYKPSEDILLDDTFFEFLVLIDKEYKSLKDNRDELNDSD